MKVTIKYTIEVTKEIEMSCKDYCLLHADYNHLNLFPVDAMSKDVYPSTEEDENILTDWLYEKQKA